MKISCQSCGAKYTIADEKVRGRTVKIRCKKCSSAIVISGAEIEAPPPGEEEDGETRIYENSPGADPFAHGAAQPPVEWTLNVAEGDQRTVVVDEIVQLYRSGVISDDTYLWKDGMEDWRPLGEVPELVEKVRAAGPAPAAGRPIGALRPNTAAASTPVPPDAALAAGGPVLGGAGASKAAARRADARPKDQDLFGSAPVAEEPKETKQQKASPSMAPLPKGSHMTAERGENSVLFTLDALKAPKPKSVAPPAGPGATSGVVDIKTLSTQAPPSMENDRALDDIMNIGGGSIMGSATLAAPVLPTTIEPEPPPPQPEYMGMGPAPVQSGGGNKVLLVVLAAALGLVVIAFGGYLVFGKSKGNDTKAPASAAASETAKPPDTAAPASADPATPAASATAPAPTDPSKPEDKKDPKDKTAPEKVPGPLKTSDTSKPADTGKKPEAKTPDPPKTEEPKAPPPPDPGGGATNPFDRGAAISALNAAAGGASGCKKPDGPTGTGRVAVTFAPSGRVTSANVEGPPFAGTSVGGCVAARFRGASVPPFAGSPVTVHKSFSIN
ncbi:MAG: zinc-ribbon domain-containing protein [Deltaproteobacteria bacterium]|nr:zinc-ribbon domain-containing protein [Deltaproteobacteria bacterium]